MKESESRAARAFPRPDHRAGYTEPYLRGILGSRFEEFARYMVGKKVGNGKSAGGGAVVRIYHPDNVYAYLTTKNLVK